MQNVHFQITFVGQKRLRLSPKWSLHSSRLLKGFLVLQGKKRNKTEIEYLKCLLEEDYENRIDTNCLKLPAGGECADVSLDFADGFLNI